MISIEELQTNPLIEFEKREYRVLEVIQPRTTMEPTVRMILREGFMGIVRKPLKDILEHGVLKPEVIDSAPL